MNVKDLLGDNYKDGITVDEINNFLMDKNFIDSETVPKGIDKTTFDKTASELAKLKKDMSAKMSEDEKKQQADAELAEHYVNLKKDNCKLVMEKEFAIAGFSANEYSELIGTFATDDADMAIKFAKSVASFRTTDKANIEKKLKQEALNSMTTPNSSGSGYVAIDYDKAITNAQASGDKIAVASLIRQKCEYQQSNKEV